MIKGDVMNEVCAEFCCSLDEVQSPSVKGHLVDARSTYVYLVRKHFGDSLAELSMHLKRKDHTASHYLLKRVEKLMFVKDNLAKRIERIEKKLFNQL